MSRRAKKGEGRRGEGLMREAPCNVTGTRAYLTRRMFIFSQHFAQKLSSPRISGFYGMGFFFFFFFSGDTCLFCFAVSLVCWSHRFPWSVILVQYSTLRGMIHGVAFTPETPWPDCHITQLCTESGDLLTGLHAGRFLCTGTGTLLFNLRFSRAEVPRSTRT